MSKVRSYLGQEHGGSEAVETVILTPLMFMTFMILLYFLFMALTFICYNNVANSIAQDLNMRQTGFSATLGYGKPTIVSSRGISGSATLAPSAIQYIPNTTALAGGSNWAIDKHKHKLIIPFSEVTGIKVTTSKPVNTSNKRRMAGTVVRVEIGYKTMVMTDPNRPTGLIPMKAVGYNIIA